MLLSIPAAASVADIVRVVKTNSSRWAHETWPTRSDFAWQRGYGSFSVSESNINRIQQYIANQEQHHRTISFKDEFLALLRKHNIEYDEEYLEIMDHQPSPATPPSTPPRAPTRSTRRRAGNSQARLGRRRSDALRRQPGETCLEFRDLARLDLNQPPRRGFAE